MALKIADMVKEVTATSGTGSYALAGAVDGFETFSAFMSNGDETYYCVLGADSSGDPAFEVGRGTYATSGNTLARTEVLTSSNSDAAVNWGSGTNKVIRCVAPAAAQLYLDADGVLVIPLTVSGQKIIAMGNSGSSLALTYANVVTVTLTASTTLTLPTMAANVDEEAQMVVEMTQNGTGGYTVALASPGGTTIKYGSGATGVTVLSGANTRTDILVRKKYGETVYYVSALDNWS